jgi:hypothetical protein
MTRRRLTPSQRRVGYLCRLRRPLTDDEVSEVLRLSKHIRQSQGRKEYFTEYKRERYAKDPAFREAQKARVAAYKARRRAEAKG